MDLICGINPVLEALEAQSRHFDRLMVVKGMRNRRVAEAIARATSRGVPLRFEARETLDRLSGGLPHQGLIAVVSPKPVMSLEELVDGARHRALLLLLDGVVDPRNLGALLRCADAAGADGVVLPDRHTAGLSEVVSRASAGALEHVRVARVGNLAQAVVALQERGLWVVALDAAGGERWDAVDYDRPLAFVVGGEGRGVRRLVKERCDQVVSLPLFGRVESLNVSVAAGIALYEVVRQRRAVPSQVRPIPIAPPVAVSRVLGPGEDDEELDPGLPGPLAAAADAVPEEEEEPEPLSLVSLGDEEVAWGAGGSVEVVRRRAQVRNPGGRGRRGGPGGDRGRGRRKGGPPSGEARPTGSRGPGRRKRRRRGGGAPAPAAPEGAAAPAAEAAAPRSGRRRRRKRRR